MGRGQLACLVLILCHVIIRQRTSEGTGFQRVVQRSFVDGFEHFEGTCCVPPSSVLNVSMCSQHRMVSHTDTVVRL